ncbi:MAG: FKBP-type peptidyl-prolyl cis-trans isomerase, partial [Rikenellaceae bacterium]|nr:FKBP-type peptidyl-prolyl cis-trans isomerase [Rikenellaceae bacterium]
AVIKGWGEGVMLIGQGGKIKMWLHPDLAYGPQAMSEEIGPNAALYFEVELLEVMPDITAEEPAEEATEEVVEE